MTKHLTAQFYRDFTNSYLQTAEWADGESPNSGFSKEATKDAYNECRKFISMVANAFTFQETEAILTHKGFDVSYDAAHEFYLTRNHHGAGFWDGEKPWDSLANDGASRLTILSQSCGTHQAYRIRKKLSFQ